MNSSVCGVMHRDQNECVRVHGCVKEMSNAARVTLDEMSPVVRHALKPFYAQTASMAKTPCMDEFLDLIECITSPPTRATCLVKYESLKKCLRANGLSV